MNIEKKWTPGPWEIQRDSGLHIYVTQPQDLPGRQAGYYAEVRRFTSNQEQVEANAHLITAAPELYDALNEALEDWDDVHWDEECPHRIEWADKARAALAKARGEQP